MGEITPYRNPHSNKFRPGARLQRCFHTSVKMSCPDLFCFQSTDHHPTSVLIVKVNNQSWARCFPPVFHATNHYPSLARPLPCTFIKCSSSCSSESKSFLNRTKTPNHMASQWVMRRTRLLRGLLIGYHGVSLVVMESDGWRVRVPGVHHTAGRPGGQARPSFTPAPRDPPWGIVYGRFVASQPSTC